MHSFVNVSSSECMCRKQYHVSVQPNYVLIGSVVATPDKMCLQEEPSLIAIAN